MNILYTINDKFVPQAAACMTSICENNKSSDSITFYIMGMGISDSNNKKLCDLAERYGRNSVIIEIGAMEQYFDFSFNTTGWNEIVLARLLVDRILPNEIKRVIYLDGDTIVRGNLSDMWNIDLGDKTLAMSVETTVNRKNKAVLGLEDELYYNAGVLLIDLDKWRSLDCGKRIIEYYEAHNGRLFANDQDAINAVLKDEIYQLLPSYNFCNTYTQYPYWFLRQLVKPQKYIEKNIYEECKRNPIIIHYLGEDRPWRRGNTHKYKTDYERYLGMTEWADTQQEEGWELYFVVWKCFNTITKPFPRLRYSIITNMIPIVMKRRSKKKTSYEK